MRRGFKGVWIKKEVWLNPDITIAEKCLLVEIDSLDNEDDKGCFASNEYLAEFLNCAPGTIANMITSLKKRGYIKQVFFDGRNRGLSTLLRESRVPEFGRAEHTEAGEQSTPIEDYTLYSKEPIKKRVRVKHTFVPPTQEEVREFFKENGQPIDVADKAYDHYTKDDAKWHDSQGNPVRNWKQKCRTVWFNSKFNSTNNDGKKTEAAGSSTNKRGANRGGFSNEELGATFNEQGGTNFTEGSTV